MQWGKKLQLSLKVDYIFRAQLIEFPPAYIQLVYVLCTEIIFVPLCLLLYNIVNNFNKTKSEILELHAAGFIFIHVI